MYRRSVEVRVLQLNLQGAPPFSVLFSAYIFSVYAGVYAITRFHDDITCVHHTTLSASFYAEVTPYRNRPLWNMKETNGISACIS